MSKYTIIEDGSPFYIKFTFDGLNEIIAYINQVNQHIIDNKLDCYPMPYWANIPSPYNEELMSKLPFPAELDINPNRLGIWTSTPGLIPSAHKDGEKTRWGINFGVNVKDDKVPTEWFDEKELLAYELDDSKCDKGIGKRQLVDFNRDKHEPIKSVVLKQDEAILVNVDMFHTWNHTLSRNERVILTTRAKTHGDVYFDDVKKILFPDL